MVAKEKVFENGSKIFYVTMKQLKVKGKQAQGHTKTWEIPLPKFFFDQRKEYVCKGQRKYCSYLDVRRQELEQCG